MKSSSFFVLALFGCSNSSSTSAEPNDSGSVDSMIDVAVDVSSDAHTFVDAMGDAKAGDVDPADVTAPSCATKVSGTTAFAVTLSGMGTADGGTISGFAELYFPEGRVAGKPVVIAVPRYFPSPARVLTKGVLDATLSASLTASDPDCIDGISGVLVGPADGMDATLTVNTSKPSDAVATITARAALCPSGTPPSPSFIAGSDEGPTRKIKVIGNTPLAVASLASVKATPPRDLVVEEVGTTFTVAGKNAFDPFTKLTIDLSGVHDVLGRSLGLGTVETKALTGSITDGTFASAPPSGSVLGNVTITDGVLRAIDTGSATTTLVLGLGAQGSKTAVHVRHRLDCTSGGDTRVSLVSEKGEVVDIETGTGCSSTMLERTTTIPASAARWALVVVRRFYDARPCWTPSYAGPIDYYLDSIAFE